jgi:hypothetical protein
MRLLEELDVRLFVLVVAVVIAIIIIIIIIIYYFIFLKPSGNYIYHMLEQSIILHFPHRVCLWVSYDSQCKQRLFP